MTAATVRIPEWIKVRAPGGGEYARVKGAVRAGGLATVCEEARCPNVAECWGAGTATIMVLGDTCTRACRFCAVKTGHPHGRVDADEPRRVAEAVARMGLHYVVLTCVDRDDLADGGAEPFAACVRAVRARQPGCRVEALTSDYRGDEHSLRLMAESGADVLAHNLEVVERLTPLLRDRRCAYRQSLHVLASYARLSGGGPVKTSLMLGLGERDDEVQDALSDARAAGVRILTLGQYLRPSPRHHPVIEFIPPERFQRWAAVARELGFESVFAGPLVRSSYRAGETRMRCASEASPREGLPVASPIGALRAPCEGARTTRT